MKGVILDIHPDARIVDITHSISPQNVDEAAFVLKSAYSFFPPGTLHVVVVDPGVGTPRAVLIVRTDRYVFLSPDNGVLKFIFHEHPAAEVFRVINERFFLKEVSRTFHGRDIFAPVAAYLSKGTSIEAMGEPFSEYIRGEVREPMVSEQSMMGEIIYIDRFGNGITNIRADRLAGRDNVQIKVKSHVISKLSETYSDVSPGEVLALPGSGGTLEISIHRGSAENQMGLRIGEPVTVTWQ